MTDTVEGSCRSGGAVGLVLAMLETASAATRMEVWTLLAADLQIVPSAAELRVIELGFLSSLLQGPLSGGSEFRTCERAEYDRRRPEIAPPSRQLVDAYGSWSRVCRAAYGLQTDGTTVGPGKPWPTPNRGELGQVDYTRDEVLAAVRLCANQLRAAGLAGVPTSWQYDEWVRRRKLKAKKHGRKLRLPYAHSIYRLFTERARGESRWRSVLRIAGLD